ncbi:AMP-binding domain protein [Diplogelasinospora grovesii]|uniref:AMP-binding domain protein n=1 Tax=Diplogelasinospora grovesii TaxID=303347 RepID=A0AAN6S486_9PEZI|nr:AMP-binding domain protein [Diplogelasinospora grovesii]
MSPNAPPSRLKNILGHLLPSSSSQSTPEATAATTTTPPSNTIEDKNRNHIHQLSPTFFLERAAAIEPDGEAIYHVTANGQILRRSYIEFADRARGLAYFLRKHGLKRVGILAPNTPAFLESIFGIVAAGGVMVPVNYRLKSDDISYIMNFGEVDSIIADAEYVHLLDAFRKEHPTVPIIIDNDTDATEGELSGPFDEAVLEGLTYDRSTGSKGWSDLLSSRIPDEDDMLAIPFTSGTTSKPKGVVYTHRGAYMAALGNVVESGLNAVQHGRCRYLWTLPMFHAVGWTFPWAVCAVRGTHVCLRKIDYPLIWRLLREEGVTHFSAAPTVNTLLCAAAEAARLPNPVRVTVAASPPTAHLFEQMSKLNLQPVHVYGLTETYGPITKGYHMPFWDASPNKYALMARQGHGFLPSLPVRVVKPDVLPLEDVAKDGKEIGEIVFLGNLCAKEYYKDPEATRKMFLGGAMHSGDLAVWHPDGSAHIQDRAKDIIISGGENISSVALESMLVEHPDVLEAGVVAVPDSHWGERPKAYITVKPGQTMTGQGLIDWARNQSSISKFMVPREVEIVKELPKTSTGKIQKNVLRDWARGDKTDDA